ncbi:MAG: NAD(P)H-dependent oxidoreductase subunit E [Gammaproteobacteria bacterium]
MSNSVKNNSLISESVRKEIDRWLKKYPPEHKQSGVLYALRVVQEQNSGWLTVELLDAVADYLQIPKITVYEVATFYSMYNLKPVGRHTFSVCCNISCMLRGSEKMIEHLQKRLGISVDETTADGRFTLREVECLAACGGAPVMQLDDKHYHENLTPEKIDTLLEELMGEK